MTKTWRADWETQTKGAQKDHCNQLQLRVTVKSLPLGSRPSLQQGLLVWTESFCKLKTQTDKRWQHLTASFFFFFFSSVSWRIKDALTTSAVFRLVCLLQYSVMSWFMNSTALTEHFLAYVMHFKLFTCHLTPSPFDEFMMCRSQVSFILVTNNKAHGGCEVVTV